MNKPYKKDRPFTLGFRVFRKGQLQPDTKMLRGNPFHLGSVASKEWERGFNAAYYRNLGRRHDFSMERSRKSFQKNGGKYGK